jgi:hypothetical protein
MMLTNLDQALGLAYHGDDGDVGSSSSSSGGSCGAWSPAADRMAKMTEVL